VAQLNLAAGPLVIDVPDTRGRYYVLQLLDAYSNTSRYVGRRTTGTDAGSYALVPPVFSGALPPRRQADHESDAARVAARPHAG
jgi:hypothetical protein